MTDSPARVTPKVISDALKSALTAFLTPDTANPKAASTDAEIKTLQSALGMPANLQTGNARVLTYQALQSSLGTPAEIQANTEIHSGITARITALTGIRPGQTPPPTPEQISAALSGLSRDQIAEVQILTGLIGLNNQALTNGQPNVDGRVGPRTISALTNFASYNPAPATAPTVAATTPATAAPAATASTPVAPAAPAAAATNSQSDSLPIMIVQLSGRPEDRAYLAQLEPMLDGKYQAIFVNSAEERARTIQGLRSNGEDSPINSFVISEGNLPRDSVLSRNRFNDAQVELGRRGADGETVYSLRLDANNSERRPGERYSLQGAAQIMDDIASGRTEIKKDEPMGYDISVQRVQTAPAASPAPAPAAP